MDIDINLPAVIYSCFILHNFCEIHHDTIDVQSTKENNEHGNDAISCECNNDSDEKQMLRIFEIYVVE